MQHTPQVAAKIARLIAEEINAQPQQALSAIALLDEGATVPFIARYRKEVTGGLDDTQLRNLEMRLTYLRELEDRRVAVSFDERPLHGERALRLHLNPAARGLVEQ